MFLGKKRLYFVLPYKACCTACEAHIQNILDRQFGTDLGSALGNTQHWCLMKAALLLETMNTHVCQQLHVTTKTELRENDQRKRKTI